MSHVELMKRTYESFLGWHATSEFLQVNSKLRQDILSAIKDATGEELRIVNGVRKWVKADHKPLREPIVQDEMPNWDHESGGPWVQGLTADGKVCWI